MEETLPVTAIGSTGWTATEFDEIVRQYQSRIYRVLWCELRDEEAAATLTQECFLKAYRARAAFRGESGIGTWLVRIAINLARDHQRSRRQGFWRRLISSPADDGASALELAEDRQPPVDRALIARQQLEQTMAAVKELSPQQQTVFHLRFVEELSLEEIAHAMDIEAGTVKSHLSRAVGALRQQRKPL